MTAEADLNAESVCDCGHSERLHFAGRCNAADDTFECDCDHNDGDRRCPRCNDEGIVHTRDGQIIGPCECAQIGGSTDG